MRLALISNPALINFDCRAVAEIDVEDWKRTTHHVSISENSIAKPTKILNNILRVPQK